MTIHLSLPALLREAFHWWIFYKDSGPPPSGRNWVKIVKISNFLIKNLVQHFYHKLSKNMEVWLIKSQKFFQQKWKLLLQSLAKDQFFLENIHLWSLNPNQVTWSLFCLGNLISFSRGWNNHPKNLGKFDFYFFYMKINILQKKIFLFFFQKVPKKAPGGMGGS